MSGPPPPHVFECGCRIENIDDKAVITACPLGEKCEVVQIALAETAAQGTPSTIIDAR